MTRYAASKSTCNCMSSAKNQSLAFGVDCCVPMPLSATSAGLSMLEQIAFYSRMQVDSIYVVNVVVFMVEDVGTCLGLLIYTQA
eukprot:14970856-Ditylum_brightwellii.AAC.1